MLNSSKVKLILHIYIIWYAIMKPNFPKVNTTELEYKLNKFWKP